MGYTIEYIGRFTLDKPLTEEHAKFLRDFAKTRHYVRAYPEDDPNGIFFTDPKGELEPTWKDLDYKELCLSTHPNALRKKKEYELSKWGCIELNDVNPGMPSFYCQWVPTEENQGIEWDGNEKFYKAFDWLKFIIKYYLEPWGYVLNGAVEIRYGSNEYPFENGVLEVRDNEVTYDSDELYETLDEEPEYVGFADEYKDDLIAINPDPKYKNWEVK